MSLSKGTSTCRPFTQEPHLRLRLAFGSGIYDTTSIGIVVVKG